MVVSNFCKHFVLCCNVYLTHCCYGVSDGTFCIVIMFILSIVVVGLVVEQDLAALLATGLEPKWHHKLFYTYVCL